MSDLKRFFSPALRVVVVGLVASAWLAGAQPQNGKANWDNLKRLAPGDQIKIVLNDAKAYAGQFQTVSDDAVVVRLVTGEQTFTRESVLRVSAKGQSHRGRNALIGLGIGAGIGAAVGGASDPNQEVIPGGPVAAAVMGVGFGVTGAVVGAILPTGGWHDVYRAR